MRNSQILGINDFIGRRSCPFCRSKGEELIGKVYTPLYYSLPTGYFSLSEDAIEKRYLYKCSTCGIIYHSLIPKKDTLVRIYNSSNITNNWTFDAERGLGNKIELVKNLTKSGSILDVGCHTGEFLGQIGNSNFELWGVELLEISSKIAEEKYSVKMIRGTIEEVELPKNYFSAVTMWDVMEHLSDVKAAITNVYNALKKGGILLIETGNIKCSPARLLKGNWWYVSLLEHFTFYDKLSLQKILSDMGFKVVDIVYTIHSKWRLNIFIDTLIRAVIFSVLNFIDKEAIIYKKTAKWLKKAGYPPSIRWKDHILVVAKKM